MMPIDNHNHADSSESSFPDDIEEMIGKYLTFHASRLQVHNREDRYASVLIEARGIGSDIKVIRRAYTGCFQLDGSDASSIPQSVDVQIKAIGEASPEARRKAKIARLRSELATELEQLEKEEA